MSVDLTKKKKKKVGFNKPVGGDATFQLGGADYSAKALKDKALKILASEDGPAEDGCKVNSVDLYVKPEDGKCYFVAHTSRGDCSGDFGI